jgi:PAS domain S-box-containing protein
VFFLATVSPEEVKFIALQNAETLWNKSTDGHLILDRDGRFVFVNKAVEEKTDFSRKELIGKKFFEVGILSVASRELTKQKFIAFLLGKQFEPYEIEVMTKFGEKKAYELNSTPIFKENKMVGIYVVLRDLAERKKLEAALRKQNSHLKETVLLHCRDLSLELDSLQSFLSDLEKKCKSGDADKLKKGIQMSDELEKTLKRLIGKVSE